MPQTLKIIVLTLLFALGATALGAAAQEAQEDPAADATRSADSLPPDDGTAVPDESDAESQDEEIDDSDLDLQTYEEDDDDFVPTEEIPADEPIPFPSNI